MTTAASPRPRFQRRLFSRRGLLRLVFVVVCLVTLFFLAMAVETWRSAREWRAWRAAAEARGERFDWASIIPPTPSPEQNFAATPLFLPLFDYTVGPNGQLIYRDSAGEERLEQISATLGEEKGPRLPGPVTWATGSATDLAVWANQYHGNSNYPPAPDGATSAQAVLAALGRFDTEMEELRVASKRPQSIFPLHYSDGAGLRMVHLSVLQNLEEVAVLRALALGRTGLPERAFDELLLAQRLAEALRTEPTEVSTLARVGNHRFALQPVWEALAARRLNAGQLTELQASLATVNYVAQMVVAVRTERTFSYYITEQMRTGAVDFQEMFGHQPMGSRYQLLRFRNLFGWFFYRSELVTARYYTEGVLPVLDPVRGTADLRALAAMKVRMEPLLKSPLNMLAGILTANFDGVFRTILRGQAGQNMAVAACALERWRLTHDAYPETLDALVPTLLDKAPVDPVNGQPLHYRRTPAGRYLLYSVGGSGRDSGGQPDLTQNREPPLTAGDWIWSYEKLDGVGNDGKR